MALEKFRLIFLGSHSSVLFASNQTNEDLVCLYIDVFFATSLLW